MVIYPRQQERRLAWLVILATVLMLFLAVCACGCGNIPTPQEARQTLDDFKTQLGDLRAQAATRPSDKAIADQISKLESKVIPAADALVKAYEQGKPDALVGVISGQFGPWGTLAGIGVTVGWGVYQQIQKRNAAKALKQTVKGLAGLPLSEDQKNALAASQDASTKAQVAVIKAQ